MPLAEKFGDTVYDVAAKSLTESGIEVSAAQLKQLAEDLEQLHTLYYGDAGKMMPGTLCWRTQALEDQTTKYAKRAEEYPAKTIYLPYVNPEDVDKRIRHRKGVRNDNYQWSDRREVAQMVRLLWSAYEQGTSLTIGELSVIMNRSLGVIGKYVKEYYAENPDKTLPLRGYIYDQGSNPTHKALICTLWERGVGEADIAQRTNHHLKSVGRYLNHYRRVMQLMEKGMTVDEIAHLVGIGKRVVLEYTRIASQIHPKLAKKQTLKKTKKYQKPTRGHLAL
jgi:hypothetical protein